MSFPTFLGDAGDRVLFLPAPGPGRWWTVGADGSAPAQLDATLYAEEGAAELTSSHDGRYAAHLRRSDGRGRPSIVVIDTLAGSSQTVTYTGKPVWGRGRSALVMPAADGGFYVHNDRYRLLHWAPGASGLETVPILRDGRREDPAKLPKRTGFDAPDEAGRSTHASAFGYCRHYHRYKRGRPRDALGILDQNAGVIRMRTIRSWFSTGHCWTSDDGSTIASVTAGPGKNAVIALRRGRLVRVPVGRYTTVHSISPSGQYLLATAQDRRGHVRGAPARLIDLERRRSFRLAQARHRFLDSRELVTPDRLVRWTPDESHLVFQSRNVLVGASTATGRSWQLDGPKIPADGHLRMALVSRDGQSITGVIWNPGDSQGAYGEQPYATPVRGGAGARFLIPAPRDAEFEMQRSRDGRRTLVSGLAANASTPERFMLTAGDPNDPAVEAWNLP